MTVQKSMVCKAVPKTVGSGSGKAVGAEPVKISHMQIWVDLLPAGVQKETVDQQPNAGSVETIISRTAFPAAADERQFPETGGLQDYLDFPGEEEYNLLDSEKGQGTWLGVDP